MAPEKQDEFDAYMARFAEHVGDIQTGQYGRYKGRLVRKLDPERFSAKLDEYHELGQRFLDIINAGDTIDDALAVDLRAAEIELLIQKSTYLPFGS